MRPTDRAQRWLFGGACTTLVLAGAYRLGPIWLDWHAASVAHAARMSGLLASEQERLGRLPELLDTAEARIGRVRNAGTGMLVAEDTTQAMAMITALIAELGRVHNVRIAAARPVPDTMTSGELRVMRVAVQAVTDVQGVADVLAAIEQPSGPLAVRRISVRPADVNVPDTQPETLHLAMTVDALVLIRTKPADGSVE